MKIVKAYTLPQIDHKSSINNEESPNPNLIGSHDLLSHEQIFAQYAIDNRMENLRARFKHQVDLFFSYFMISVYLQIFLIMILIFFLLIMKCKFKKLSFMRASKKFIV